MMHDRCRFILLLEYANDDELIATVALIERHLPDYDYASRPFARVVEKGFFKFLAFKEPKLVEDFNKFAQKCFALQGKIGTVRLTPGYVSLVNATSAALSYSPGALLIKKGLWLKAQLVLSGKLLMSYSLSDELFKDKRSIVYLNDVRELVKGALQ